jgi:hypothetical protein
MISIVADTIAEDCLWQVILRAEIVELPEVEGGGIGGDG